MSAPNALYDLVAVLHNKMKGVNAYEQYASDFPGNDAVANVLQAIKQDDERHIEQLQEALFEALQDEMSGSSSSAEEKTEEPVSRERGQGAASTRASQRAKTASEAGSR